MNVCSYVSLPRTVETKRPIITNSPDSFISQKNISNGDINHNRINIKVSKNVPFLHHIDFCLRGLAPTRRITSEKGIK